MATIGAMFGDDVKRTCVAWIAALVYFLAHLSPTEGLVLCIGPDGHVAIEIATPDAACSDCRTEAAATAVCCAAPGTELHECECSDIPIVAIAPDLVSTAPSQHGVAMVPAPSVLAGSEAVLSPPLRGISSMRSDTFAPPRPRVPALLPLRI